MYRPDHLTLNLSGQLLSLERAVVMGIINVTPDSFYSTSRIAGEQELRTRIDTLLREGASIADLGAYSSRLGAEEVSAQEEMRRLAPALRILRDEYPALPVSVDTFRADVARWAVQEYGVAMINDISGGALAPQMYPTIAELQVPYILMHMRGTPQTMGELTNYQDLILDLIDYFIQRVGQLTELGVHDIVLDPGFGFSKTLEQNYELLARMSDLGTVLPQPLLVGISRKSMIYRLLGQTPEEALNGTSILHAFALERGAKILRVHDVAPAVEAIRLYEAMHPYERRDEALYYTQTNTGDH